MLKRSIALLLLLGLNACQATLPSSQLASPTSPPVVKAPAWLPELRDKVATLPVIQLAADATVVAFAYPGESLFSDGAALPLAGGAEVLDPLSDLLSAFPEARWIATVRAATSNGADYDAALAQKRAELLKLYLFNRGVPAARIEWHTAAGAGAPLEFALRSDQWTVGSSSGVKE